MVKEKNLNEIFNMRGQLRQLKKEVATERMALSISNTKQTGKIEKLAEMNSILEKIEKNIEDALKNHLAKLKEAKS